MKSDNSKNIIKRPPVVVVVGHIDHGKSTLLDYIRKTNSTDKEAGGITQHISAYEAEVEVGGEKRKITFLDTPGHEAFYSLRERGTRIADIAILIVSGEDGVKPQTVEALNCIKKDGAPFIVAITKIDKQNANIDKVKQDLAEKEVFVEGWGGTVPVVPISSKTGENIKELLEMIILQSDLEDFKGDKNSLGEGFVIESDLNPKQGVSATLLIKNGSLKSGMYVASRDTYAPVRIMQNYAGTPIKEASFSSPVKITGWTNAPISGEEFRAFESKDEAISFMGNSKNLDQSATQDELKEGQVALSIVLKTDTIGSQEAVEHEIRKLNNDRVIIKIISKGIGSITEKDVKTANIKKSLIVGFNVSTEKSTEALALRENTEIKNFNIIYELIDFLKNKMVEITPIITVETTSGVIKILKTFSKNKDKQVVGGKVEEGEIKSGNNVKVWRKDSMIGEGKVKEIQSQKIKTDIVREGEEFGMMIESKIDLAPGDLLKAISFIKQ